MIKESFTLNRNSWHASLMKRIWGYRTSDFSHICPYFWLSIFNVLVFIPYEILRFILTVIVGTVTAASNLAEKYENKSYEKMARRMMTDPAYKEKIASRVKSSRWCRLLDRAERLFSYEETEILRTERWKQNELKENKQRELRKLKDRKAIETKRSINASLKAIKPLLQFLLAAATLVALFYLGKLIIELSTIMMAMNWSINWTKVLNTLGAILGIIGIACVVVFTILGIVKLLSNASPSIARFFIWMGDGIKLTWDIVVQIIKNNCPSIEWKD